MENPQTETQKVIKSDKYLSRVLIAAALIILGVVFIIIALNQPRVVSEEAESTVQSSVSDYTESNSDAASSVPHSSVSNKTEKAVSFPIHLNNCTAEDLMAIDNVGETRANAIIAYREYLGGYTSVEQLKNISGIGDSVYASIAPYVTV
ncbi:MAG: helix-hairpin-helix domain-containing protein [Eubacterium sp.]|nr:helix-hairpin-helix domain-containing protein [Eubacterium sp.]